MNSTDIIPADLSTESGPMTSLRKTSLVGGGLYLLTFISIPTLALYQGIHEPNFILGTGPDTPVIIGVILELVVALAGIGTAIVLYPVLRKQNEGMAIGLIGSRVLEASTMFAGVAFLLSVVALRQNGAGADALIIGQTQVAMYDRMFLVGQSFMPAINDLLLGFLLYHSRLVPRGLSLVGIVGGILLITGDVCILFGLIEQHAPSTGLFAIAVALFEFSLGVWLLAKGMNASTLKENQLVSM